MVATELSVYDRIADPMAAAKFMGAAISKSGMFGVAGEKQGEVLALECLVRRQPPLMLAETYHVIHGRLSMKADKMLANFNERGGKHKVVSRTSELAIVEMSCDGCEPQTFSLSWEQAQEEPFIYSGKESDVVAKLVAGERDKLKIKDKYATPRARMQMLWARVISDGVRTMMPAANCGRYTPEEIDDDNLPAPGQTQLVATETIDENTAEGQVVEDVAPEAEAPFEATEAPVESPAPEGSDDGFATAEQSKLLNNLYSQLALTPDQIAKALQKRGASANRSLKFEAAEELIRTLTNALANKQLPAQQVEQATEEVAGELQRDTNQPVGPATPEQVEQAKSLLKELAQTAPAQFNRYVAHMKANGLKAADLSYVDCQALINDLLTKNLAAFFDLSLQKWQPAAEGDSKN